jgi:hypothetical protein
VQNQFDLIAILKDAINRAVPVGFVSSDHIRKFCPQILGTKIGEWHVFGWQYDGETSPGRSLPEWRCIELHDIQSEIEVLTDEWRAGWTKGIGAQSCVDTVIAMIDPAHGPEIRNTFPERTPTRVPARRGLKTRW